MSYVCNLCGQPLAGPLERCNSGIHQGPDDLNGFRGTAVPAEWFGDEKAHKLREDARAYRNRLVARGHCPVHLVAECGCEMAALIRDLRGEAKTARSQGAAHMGFQTVNAEDVKVGDWLREPVDSGTVRLITGRSVYRDDLSTFELDAGWDSYEYELREGQEVQVLRVP